MCHPLRLAEDFLTANILTGGRMIFGVGRGCHICEAETFGIPMLNREANRQLLERAGRDHLQGVQRGIVFEPGQALHLAGRVPYRGDELAQLTPVPRPIHARSGAATDRQRQPARSRFTVRHGIAGAVGGGAATMQARPITAYREAAVRAGTKLALGQDPQLAPHFHLGETREQAVGGITPIYAEHAKIIAPPGFVPGPPPTQLPRRAPRRLGRCRCADGRHGSGLLVRRRSGTARRPAQGLREALPGMQHIFLSSPIGTPNRSCSSSSSGFRGSRAGIQTASPVEKFFFSGFTRYGCGPIFWRQPGAHGAADEGSRMQSQNRFLDDLARVASGALGTLSGVRTEVETRLREQLERVLAGMDLVSRDEFEAVKAMAAKARSEQEDLAHRVAELESKLAAFSSRETAERPTTAPSSS